MTPLNKTVQRRTTGSHRGRRFIVILEPGDVIGFRAERTRKVFYTSLAACYDMAVRQHALAERAAKKAAKKRGF
jgi:hypothetical protein